MGYIPEDIYEKITGDGGDIYVDETGVEKKACGGSTFICNIEYSLKTDGSPECCRQENNPTCSRCLHECMLECGEKGLGLNFCFMGDDGKPSCTCSNTPPTCYRLEDLNISYTPTTTLQTREPVETGGPSPILILLIILVVGIALYYFMQNMR